MSLNVATSMRKSALYVYKDGCGNYPKVSRYYLPEIYFQKLRDRVSLLPYAVVMAGIIAIYGLVVSVIIGVNIGPEYTPFKG